MTARTLASILALSSVACMKPNPLVYTLGDSETGTDDGSGDGDGDGDTSSDSTTPVSADLPFGSCDAAAPFQPGCSVCLADSCCELAAACSADDCVCLATCMLAGGNVGTCRNECGGAMPTDIPQLQPLLDCASDSCASDCTP